MDGIYMAFCHVPLFVVLQPVVRKSSRIVAAHQQCLCQEKCNGKKIIQTICALMISQNIDLLVGDFNGTGWRCRSRDNISTIDEVFSDCALPTAGPHIIVGTPIHTEQLGGRLWVFSSPWLSTILESEQTWCLFHSSTSSCFTSQ